MRHTSRELLAKLALGAAMVSLMPAMAQAQIAGDAPAAPAAQPDIVVTGTQIRGVAPAGSNVVGISAEQIKATGGNTTNQILSSLPQLGNLFGNMASGVSPIPGSNSNSPITRPNLRNLPDNNSSGGDETLILLDGHRMVGAGVGQLGVDPDAIPTAALERVEAMLDGGSALYGSDALGGVLNFITRRKYDGVSVNATYGLADDYHSINASAIAGKDWGTGGFYVAYGYSHNDAVYGPDRDWIRRVDWSTPALVPTGRSCASPNITVGGSSYVVSGAGLAPGGPNVCDISDNAAYFPEVTFHNAMARLVQDLSDSIHFQATALYTNRRVLGDGGALGNGSSTSNTTASVIVQPTNPFYRNVSGAGSALPQTVAFDFSPVFGNYSNHQLTTLESWSVVPQLDFDLGHRWQLRTLFSYGNSETRYANDVPPSSANLQALVTAGLLNPYDVAASDPATLAAIGAGQQQGIGHNELFDYRAIVDGPLFALPGGDLHTAVGAEYTRDNFSNQITNSALVLGKVNSYTQTVKSLFGELQIPLVSARNDIPLIHQLSVSASARYDEYSDFGHTFNPKFGLTYEPVSWVSVHGSWGRSFSAPTPADQLGSASTAASLLTPTSPTFIAPASVAGVCGGTLPACTIAGSDGVFISGAVSPLQPQKARSWSIGLEVKPPIIPGLTLSANYYEIKLTGTIGRPVGATLTPFYTNFPSLYIYHPTGQQVRDILAEVPSGNTGFTLDNPNSTAQATVQGGTPVSVILDTRTRNLGEYDFGGLDFGANYVIPTGFGSITASVDGNYQLKQTFQASAASAIVNNLQYDISRLRIETTLGAKVGALNARVSWDYISGYTRSDGTTVAAYGQTKVSPFNQVNLFLEYDLNGAGALKDVSLTLNVKNLLDAAPPLYVSSSQPGFVTRVLSIGRMVQMGIAKKF